MGKIRTIILICLLISPLGNITHSDELTLADLPEADRYGTSELITRTADGAIECLSWCVTKIQIQVLVIGPIVKVFFVPVIEHNIPDYLVMTEAKLEDSAYDEWAQATGEAQLAIQQLILSLATGIETEAWGGLTETGDFGEHQSTRFFEAEIIGNPVVYFFNAIGRDGEVLEGSRLSADSGAEANNKPNPPVATNDNDSSTGGYLAKWMSAASGCLENGCRGILSFFGDFSTVFNIADYADEIIEKMEALKILEEIMGKMGDIETASTGAGSAAGYSGSFAMESYVCASDSTGFFPYYLSSIDSAVYRSGYPFVDFMYTTQFFSPNNVVRPSNSVPLLEDWGWVIPRSGFLNNDHGGRSAPVFAKRAQSVAADDNSIFRYRFLIPNSGVWQKVSPYPSNFCASNIADLNAEIDGGDAYSYNFWPRYECVTATKGVPVATVDIPDICI